MSTPLACYDPHSLPPGCVPYFMWFKQIQLVSFTDFPSLDVDSLDTQLESFVFRDCLPHHFSSLGWVPPCDQDELSSLVQSIPEAHMLCCQFEEKILPTTVIQHALKEKIKQMTVGTTRKTIPIRDKQQLKDTITQEFLPRAFTKITCLYLYIDTQNKILVMNTVNPKKTEHCIALLQRTLGQKLRILDHKKMAPVMTKWLKNNKCPSAFHIEKACLLQDPQQQHRLIRCQEQDLLAKNIQSLLQDRFDVKQLALSWKRQAHFMLGDDCTLRRLHFDDEVITAAKEASDESISLQFQSDFILMVGILTPLITQLLKIFSNKKNVSTSLPTKEAAVYV